MEVESGEGVDMSVLLVECLTDQVAYMASENG